MSMYEMAERMRYYYDVIMDRDLGAGVFAQTREGLILLAAVAAAGVLIGFLGLKLIRLWAAGAGLIIGCAGGAAASWWLGQHFGLEGIVQWVPVVILGILFAGIAAWRYRVGAFFLVWMTVSMLCIYEIRPDDMVFWGICGGIGFVCAVLSVPFFVTMTIFSTAVFGGIAGASAAIVLIPIEGMAARVGVCALGVALCVAFQLLLESRKRKKQSLRKAAEIRESHSTANEVERARALAENLDQVSGDGEFAPGDGVLEGLDVLDTDEFEFEDEDEDDEDEYESDAYAPDEYEYEEEPEYLNDEEYEGEPEYLDDEEYEGEPEYLDDEEYEGEPEYLDEDEYEGEPEYMDEDEYEGEPEYLDEDEYEGEPEYLDDEEYEGDPEYLNEDEYEGEPEYLDDDDYIEEPDYLDDEEDDSADRR